jgi:hypothetical protein
MIPHAFRAFLAFINFPIDGGGAKHHLLDTAACCQYFAVNPTSNSLPSMLPLPTKGGSFR